MLDITKNRQNVISSFMYKVYAWMAGGLAVTAATSYFVYSSSLFAMMLTNRIIFFGILLAQVGMVLGLVAFIKRLSYPVAMAFYLIYSVLLGTSLSIIFHVYELGSIGTIFGVTAGMFGFMALYGYYTEADLSGVGSILTMGLIGVIIAGVINMFMQNSMLQIVLSMISVVIFVGLTAYDVQKIKLLGQDLAEAGESMSKIALLGALILFLDFVNLFINLLTLFGKRRRD